MRDGRSNAEIAEALSIGESTVKKHIDALKKKLGVESSDDSDQRFNARIQVVVQALAHHLIPFEGRWPE